jgi:hypothetical protein
MNEMSELNTLFDALKPLLKKYQPPFESKRDEPAYYDLWSFKPVVIEGRKKREVFFAAIIIQKSYVGFYFMPVYADERAMKKVIAPELLALLKGKSCFHIKKLTPELHGQIESALQAGYELYKQRGWV